eukprot:TRINITY_DN12576_c0_g1_i1.p1 TRINITY_DN12576_c0_g1~~TRINITY_DN12576_c0_g1_i1.p1  ORF type:complete len:223 (-),score=28.49 TRINITY_DN12576_c0_g1_i1:75-743(-)
MADLRGRWQQAKQLCGLQDTSASRLWTALRSRYPVITEFRNFLTECLRVQTRTATIEDLEAIYILMSGDGTLIGDDEVEAAESRLDLIEEKVEGTRLEVLARMMIDVVLIEGVLPNLDHNRLALEHQGSDYLLPGCCVIEAKKKATTSLESAFMQVFEYMMAKNCKVGVVADGIHWHIICAANETTVAFIKNIVDTRIIMGILVGIIRQEGGLEVVCDSLLE